MAPRKAKLTVGRIRALRWALLALSVVLVGGLAALYYVGREAKPEADVHDGPSVTDEAVQQLGRGFDHTVTHEGKPLLRIRGNRDRRDKEGNLHVEEVLITAFQQDGSRYEVAADVATYSLEKREAVLTGNVSLAGPEGFALRSAELTLREGGGWLESDTPVSFQYGAKTPLTGRAKTLRAFVERGHFMLGDGVSMTAERSDGEPPFTLTATRVVFQRAMHLLRAEGDVTLKWGRSHLRCDRVAAHLAPTDNRLQFVRARWQVRSVLHDQDEEGRDRHLLAEGATLALLMDHVGRSPSRLELERGQGAPAHLRRAVPSGDEAFDLVANRIEADLVDGRVSTASATGAVTLAIKQPSSPERRLTARSAAAVFTAAGEVARLQAQGGVTLAEGRQQITGERTVITPESTEAHGSPVVLVSDRGEVRAPQLTYTTETKLVHATGGVEATMTQREGNPMRQTPLAEGDGPIRVESAEAFWREEPQSFLFRGKVRAWSGDRVIRAEQLRGEPEQQQLTAAGAVETVWFMPPPEQPAAGAPAGPRQVRVTAGTLAFDDRAGKLVYEDAVRVVDGDRTLQAAKLEVDLDDAGEAERMVATGDVRLEAPAEGRTITARRAEYDLGGQRVVFHGDPVTLKDAKGGTLSGAQAVYSTADGKVRVTAEEEPLTAARSGGESR
jgi:lipopolysaccharide transport protein LptA/LPS export ABC transporter protein LptC